MQAPKKISRTLVRSDAVKRAGDAKRSVAKQRLIDSLPSNVSLASPYTYSSDVHTFSCAEHGTFQTKASYALQSKFVCPKCASRSRTAHQTNSSTRTQKIIQTKIEKYGSLQAISEKSSLTRSSNRVKHLTDEQRSVWNSPQQLQSFYDTCNINDVAQQFGVTRDVVIAHFKRHNIKIHYNYAKSSGEKELSEFVSSLGFDTITSDRTILGGKELDIVIPLKRIAIEYNGLYWHSNAVVDNRYHENKRKQCEQLGIRLVQIWEDDWVGKQDVVKQFLMNLLGVRSVKYNARSCSVIFVSTTEADEFYDYHHMQGGRGFYTFSIALKHEDIIISCMSFIKRDDDVIELIRFANKGARGAFSKLLHHASNECRQRGYTTIISFADLEIVDPTNNVYAKHGFNEVGYLVPDYKYIENGVRQHKFGFRKKHFLALGMDSDNLTESQMAEKAGLLKAYDSGKQKYTKKLL